jgi:hypothetical protein
VLLGADGVHVSFGLTPWYGSPDTR